MSNERAFLSIGELADILVSLEPESALKVVRKQRAAKDAYMENKDNQGNCPSSQKLRDLGWKCEYDIKTGFKRTLIHLRSIYY